MEAYPTKLRELVLESYASGMTTKEIADRFKVGRPWVRGVKQRERETGVRVATKQKHGPDPFFDSARRERLEELVEATPDATLAELKASLGLSVGISTIWRTLTDMKLTLKKSPCTRRSKIGPT